MSTTPTPLTPSLYAYYESIGFRESALLKKIREDNIKLTQSNFQSAPEVAHFLAFLIHLTQAKAILEIGTFTGYSTLVMAHALSEDGHITTCDRNKLRTDTAKKNWEAGGVLDKITLRFGNASSTLQELKGEGKKFHLAFIDADKMNYDLYYEGSLELLHEGGIIALDNTLWHGEVQDEHTTCSQTKVLQALNEKIHQDPRVEMIMLPMSDGLTLVRKSGRGITDMRLDKSLHSPL
jgi:predicted O-methyltransferase YrrM